MAGQHDVGFFRRNQFSSLFALSAFFRGHELSEFRRHRKPPVRLTHTGVGKTFCGGNYFNSSRTMSRSSFNSLTVASILPWLNSLTVRPWTISSFVPLLRTGNDVMMSFSTP